MTLTALLSVALAYAVGALPLSRLVARHRGSNGRPQTSTSRKRETLASLLALVFDAGKGYGAVWATAILTSHAGPWPAAATVTVILGEMFPPYSGFRGGQGVAVAAGAFACLAPWAVAGVALLWLAVVGVWRYLSLGSILAGAALPVFAYALHRPDLPVLLAAMVAASLVIVRHSANIRRLVAGTEPRLELPFRPRSH